MAVGTTSRHRGWDNPPTAVVAGDLRIRPGICSGLRLAEKRCGAGTIRAVRLPGGRVGPAHRTHAVGLRRGLPGGTRGRYRSGVVRDADSSGLGGRRPDSKAGLRALVLGRSSEVPGAGGRSARRNRKPRYPVLRSFVRRCVRRGLQGRLLLTGERLVRDVPEKGGEQGIFNRSSKGAVVCPDLL